jgi:adenine-specific DNA-methyltransferase
VYVVTSVILAATEDETGRFSRTRVADFRGIPSVVGGSCETFAVSRLNDLLRQLRSSDETLAKEIEREVAALADRRAFGLNFERHVPEAVELPGRRVRKSDKVRVLPPRGEAPKAADEKLWRVTAIERSSGSAIAELEALDGSGNGSGPVDDLVVVAEFRDPIYPGLVSTGKVERGGDKPYHSVINAENYHALQTLLFTHRGKIDCIYIDPPYNTGAKDWKYNNDYVEGDDLYRHSKWLAFMERRLLLAKELLNPEDSVLIVTIDEKEYLRLGLLLQQVFPEASIQMVSIVINPSGTSRDLLSRVDEYAFYCFLGEARPNDVPDDLLTDQALDGAKLGSAGVRWEWLLRGGGTWYRAQRPNLCYPVMVNEDRTQMLGVGRPLSGAEDDRPTHIDGVPVAWPVRSDGRLGIWRVEARKLEDLISKGFAYISSKPNADQPTLRYLLGGTVAQIESGAIEITGRGPRGEVLVDASAVVRRQRAKTVWNRPQHIAGGGGGAQLLNRMFGDRGRFQFPKSLYAVEDALRIAVADKPKAIVLDFFAGSGTTAHAVLRLNKQDDGQRKCILVTNNEVSVTEHMALRQRGLRPGDSEWEQFGICEHITKPRVSAAITGTTPDGEPIQAEYKYTDEFPMADGFAENVEFFTLTYEAPLRVASNREFIKIAPLLWIRAGSQGRRIEDISAGWDVADAYGVLANLDHTEDFLKAVSANDLVAVAYVVTDEDRLFESVSQELPDHIEPVRLYEAYLRNFEIESGRGSL